MSVIFVQNDILAAPKTSVTVMGQLFVSYNKFHLRTDTMTFEYIIGYLKTAIFSTGMSLNSTPGDQKSHLPSSS
jgi:hypothetical protein